MSQFETSVPESSHAADPEAPPTYYVKLLDAHPDAQAPFELTDRICIIGKPGTQQMEIARLIEGQWVVQDCLDIEESYSRWARARNSEGNLEIEYTVCTHPQRWGSLYGYLVRGFMDGRQDPPVGVWGADTKPPGTGDGDGGE